MKIHDIIKEFTISDLKYMGITHITPEQKKELQKISHENNGNITRSDLKKVGLLLQTRHVREDYGSMTWGRMKSIAADMKDYVDDHKEHFDAYPVDIEIDDKIYGWDEYWKILDKVYPDEYIITFGSDGVLVEGNIQVKGSDPMPKAKPGRTDHPFRGMLVGSKYDEAECPACNGTGWDKTVTSDEDERGCDECDGTGEINEDAMSAEEIGKYPDLGWTNVNDTQEVKTYLNNMPHTPRVKIETFRQRVTEPQFQKFLKKYMTDHPDEPYDLVDSKSVTTNAPVKGHHEEVVNEESGIWKFNKEDPNNPEVLIQGFGRLMLNQIEDDLVGKFESLADMAKNKDWETIDSRLKSTIVQTKLEAILNSKSELQAIRRRGGPKSRGITKESRTSLYDALIGENKMGYEDESQFDKLSRKYQVVKHKKSYEHAAEALHTMLQRKYKENEGNWRHALGWYVVKIADGFTHVKSKVLHNYYLENYESAFIESVTETGGVGKVVPGVNTSIDVGPNEIKTQAAKFGNIVDKDGLPKKTFR